MNLGVSTSKLNTQDNNSGGNKQYITSKIFSSQQDKSNEEKNSLNISPQPTSGMTISSSQTPGTPYYPRSAGPYYSNDNPSNTGGSNPYNNLQISGIGSGGGLSSTPPRRFGINSSSSNLMHHQSHSSSTSVHHPHHHHHHHHQPPLDLAQIPIGSIYDDPKQQKQQILSQHQQQHNYQEYQKKISIQQQQSNQDQLYQSILKTQQQQQQQQQQQTPQQTPQNQNIQSNLSQQDLNNSTYNPSQSTFSNSPINVPESYNMIDPQYQIQQQQPFGFTSSISNQASKNIFIQSVPAPINQMFTEKYDKRWLTVFGFPQDKTDLVIDEISKYGKILVMEYPYQSNCNWIYLKFESESTATDILKKNGLIIANFMIGIVPYKDKIINESNPIRPQVDSYRDNSNINQSEYSPKDINSSLAPSKPSIFAKINEYVFGSG